MNFPGPVTGTVSYRCSLPPRAFVLHYVFHLRSADIIIISPFSNLFALSRKAHGMYIFRVESTTNDFPIIIISDQYFGKGQGSASFILFVSNYSDIALLIERVYSLSIWSQLPTFFPSSRQRPPLLLALSPWSPVPRTRLAPRTRHPKPLPSRTPKRFTCSQTMPPGIPSWP